MVRTFEYINNLISVIIPVYNVEDQLARCIESILAQKYMYIEIILIDDGSTDRSGEICDKYSKTYSNISVFHNRNRGVSATRNEGLERAHGEFLAFIDSDDCVSENYLKKLYDMIKEDNADIAVVEFERFYEKIPNGYETYENQYFDRIEASKRLSCEMAWVVLWGKLYRREMFDDITFPDGLIHEDEYVMHRVYYKAKKVCYNKSVLYYYSVTPNSITTKKYTSKRLEVLLALEDRLNFYKEKNEEELYRLTYILWITIALRNALILKNEMHEMKLFYELDSRIRHAFKDCKKKYHINFITNPEIYRYIYPAMKTVTSFILKVKSFKKTLKEHGLEGIKKRLIKKLQKKK